MTSDTFDQMDTTLEKSEDYLPIADWVTIKKR